MVFIYFVICRLKALLSNMDTDMLTTILDSIHPQRMFLSFLDSIGYDDSVLLDFLISSETEFLSYFTRYVNMYCCSNNLY